MKKKIFITGASSEIGVAVIKKFYQNNWFITAHLNKNIKIKRIFKNYKDISFLKHDFSRNLSTEKFIKKNKKLLRQFDAYINLTGLNKPKSFHKINSSDLYKHINTNYLSGLFISREIVLSAMKKKWGRVLLTSSIGTKFGGGENTFAYSISKFLNEFIPRNFKDLARHNVLFNCLRIGVTDTKIHKNIPNKNMKKRIKLIPTNKIAKPEEIAEYIYFLCSEKNSQITNKVLDISGGE